ncbi:MAG: hydantoinase B/oxoprolinase family protein, partial [Pirellulaceae bacterium]
FGYYETIAGGAGAGPSYPGASGVHTHMTNTRITDAEVLEQRYPVLLREFSIRRGSGGEGQFSGGDGVLRRIEFLSKLDVSILSQRRGEYPPFGLQGGEAGKVGINEVQKSDGSLQRLGGAESFTVGPGDVLTIQTPGGGGWGKEEEG